MIKPLPATQILIYLFAALVGALGLSVILGWYLQLPQLIQIRLHWVPMQFNTALGFILVSLGIFALNFKKKVAIALAIGVSLLGGLTLSQYTLGIDLHIDELLMRHYILVATSHPGRMAPNTALNFCLSGLSLLLLNQSERKNNLLGSSFIGALVMGIGTVACLGYLSNIETAYGWGRLTQMAMHTSSGFILVGLTLILQARELSLQRYHKAPEFFLPLTLMWLGTTLTITLWQALYSEKSFTADSASPVELDHPVAFGVLLLGSSLSLILSITAWFAIRLLAQRNELKKANKEILALNQQLEEWSHLDALTGIGNRRLFDLTLSKEWQRAIRYEYPIALMMIDIDFFKKYNDYYGHQKGDECIQQVAYFIDLMARRPTDLAARYGGEEFALLLTNVDLVSAKEIALELIEAIAKAELPHPASSIREFITISVGLHVTQPHTNSDMGHFIFLADKALYQAKQSGRNQLITSYPEIKT